MNGLSRISPTSQPMYLQGLSRISYLNGYTLNGYQLNAYMLNGLKMANYGEPTRESVEDFVCYMEDCAELGLPLSSMGYGNYMMQGKAERQARRARRKAKRAAKSQMKMDKRGRRARRSEARTKALEEGRGFFSQIGEAAKGLAQRGLDLGTDFAGGVMDEFQEDYELLPEVEITQDRGYLIGKTPYEPWDPKWWTAKRVPMWQKGATGAVVLIAADKILNKGKLTKNIPVIGKI
jgi:hypothetical protein